jgi:hypothetical protein
MIDINAPRCPALQGNPFTGLPPRRWLVTGGTGFIGSALIRALRAAGHQATVLSRDPARAVRSFDDGGVRAIARLDALDDGEAFDAVVNLAGAPVLGQRWSARRKRLLLASRIAISEALVAWLRRTRTRPALWLQASAIGFYGARAADERLTEDSAAGSGFMAELCQRWESAAAPAVALGTRQVVLRLGVVFGPGGSLGAMLLPYRLGLGGRLGSGEQVLSWIHRDDLLRIVAFALADDRLHGVYNATAPQPVTQAQFAATAGRLLHRPTWLHLPARPIRLLAGEMAQLLVDGQRVLPQRLEQAGFEFRHPALEPALRELLGSAV